MNEKNERLAVQGLRGPQGNQGNMGNQGNPGSQGGQGSQGEQGDRGEQGERGAAGLSRPVRRALVFLFALSMILTVGDLFWNAHQVTTSRAANHRQNEVTERKICTAVNGLVSLKPPAGNPADNPSRAYLQGLHTRFTEISRDLGCQQ